MLLIDIYYFNLDVEYIYRPLRSTPTGAMRFVNSARSELCSDRICEQKCTAKGGRLEFSLNQTVRVEQNAANSLIAIYDLLRSPSCVNRR